jgi:hypothetical protein
MKRVTFFVLLIGLELVSVSQNLVVNPGLETWAKTNEPTGWSTARNCLKDSVSINSGTYSCKQTGTSSTTKYLGQTIAVTPGKHYSLSFFYRTEVVGSEHGSRIWCSWADTEGNTVSDPASEDILRPSSYLKSSTWQPFAIEIIAPPAAASFCLEIRTYQNSIAFLDDFVFEESISTYSIEEKNQDIKTYPNPASDYLIISNVLNLKSVTLQSLSGTILWSSSFRGEETVFIPLTAFSDGAYIVRISTSGNIITRKIIKTTK